MTLIEWLLLLMREQGYIWDDGGLTIRVSQIDDIPGYEWEIDWTDPDGECWNEECHDDADLLQRIMEVLESWI